MNCPYCRCLVPDEGFCCAALELATLRRITQEVAKYLETEPLSIGTIDALEPMLHAARCLRDPRAAVAVAA